MYLMALIPFRRMQPTPRMVTPFLAQLLDRRLDPELDSTIRFDFEIIRERP